MKFFMTRGISERQADEKFAKFTEESLKRFLNNDWGDTCEEDAKLNDSDPEYAMGSYKIGEETIWIKRDYDIVTILFPSEY